MASEKTTKLVDHFFRREYGKLVAMLSRAFGFQQIELVEDMVQSAFVEALQSWKHGSIPSEPEKWIYRIAKNRMIDRLRHDTTARKHAPDWLRLHDARDSQAGWDELFAESHLEDSQLWMIFACCHPALAPEDRVAVTLHSLCGFSNTEIARALLQNESAIRKRIYRAKQRLAREQIELDVPSSTQLPERLETVHQVLYLMFNEGYSTSIGIEPIREDVCEEAARLCHLLCEHPSCSVPETSALLSLMLFQAARFGSRLDDDGRILTLEDQDRTKWNPSLIEQAKRYLGQSYEQQRVSRYHLEAGVAMYHCTAGSFATTPWSSILQLYDALIERWPSPVYLLNRAIVVAQLNGPVAGLNEVKQLAQHEQMRRYHLLEATLGELHARAGHLDDARRCFDAALRKHPSPAESKLIQQKIDRLGATDLDGERN